MEKDDYLRITIDADSDGTGALTAEISSSGFVARGTAYFDLHAIANFSKALRAFPLSQNEPPIIEGGFWSKENPGTLEQLHLSIRAYQIGGKGQVGVRVRVVDPLLWEDDRPEAQNTAEIELQTSYAALERFGADLEQLTHSKIEEAILRGEHLS
jgi:hypothetical protein